jgi:hypothetical protein
MFSSLFIPVWVNFAVFWNYIRGIACHPDIRFNATCHNLRARKMGMRAGPHAQKCFPVVQVGVKVKATSCHFGTNVRAFNEGEYTVEWVRFFCLVSVWIKKKTPPHTIAFCQLFYTRRVCLKLQSITNRSLRLGTLSAMTSPIIHSFLVIYFFYGSTALVGLDRFFSSLIYTQLVGLLGRVTSPSQGRYLHTGQHKHRINAHRLQCFEWDSNPRSQLSSGRRQSLP